MRPHTRPALGLLYLGTVLLLITSSILVFRHAMPWQRTLSVRLSTETPGLQLNPGSDVKFQGVLVGKVRRVSSDGGTATIQLAIDRSSDHLLPANVDAAILPKTLFGEKYVDLRAPAHPSAARLASGGVIHQSTTSVELGAVFDQLVPILHVLEPAKVSVLLSTLAQALDGRGAQLGQTLTTVHRFLAQVNPQLDTITQDIRDLGTTSDIYADSAADLVSVLSSTTRISHDLLVPQKHSLAAFLDGAIATATTASSVIAQSSRALVTLAGRAEPVLALLDTYSSELPCVVSTLELGDRVISSVVGKQGPWIQLSIDTVVNQAPYRYPQDLPSHPSSDANVHNLPASIPNWNPHCPRPPAYISDVFPPHADEVSVRHRPDTSATPRMDARATAADGARPAAGPAAVTEARDALARALAARDLGVDPDQVPGYVTLLLAPMLSEGQVSVR